jgi:hypothetical protein
LKKKAPRLVTGQYRIKHDGNSLTSVLSYGLSGLPANDVLTNDAKNLLCKPGALKKDSVKQNAVYKVLPQQYIVTRRLKRVKG